VSGRVVLVGAGPGDPDLISVRGAEYLRRADVVLYDSLVARELLDLVPDDAERIDVGKRSHEALTGSQAEIDALVVARARAGKLVVRLKGGDPFVFGRGGEEASACRAAGVPFEVVPGITSALAAPAFAGIPVTDRRHAASFAVVTGHRDPGRPWTSIRFDQIEADTLVVLMGMKNLEKIAESILAGGRAPETPAAVVMEGGTPRQRVVTARLDEIAARAREAGLGAPAVIVVGDVVKLRESLAFWEASALFGRRVLVTRPAEPSEPLAAALRAAGAEAVGVPMIETRALDVAASANALGRIAEYDLVVLTSANAARHFAEAIAACGVSAGALATPVVCIGAATAAAARRVGFGHVETPSARADAKSLVAALREHVEGRRVLAPQGTLARDTLVAGLREAGATVDEIAVYETVPAAVDAAALRAALVAGELDACTFASPSAAQAFAACLDEPARAAARRTVLAAIGETTAEAMRALDLAPSVVPAEPGSQALVDALAQHFAASGRGEAR
jgi:uroporphyrinogen III methyltransferase/synthase